MANDYYTAAGKTVANLDDSDETDINDINTAVEAACDLIEDDIDAVRGAREWAITVEDTVVPTTAGGNGVDEYSSLHHAAKAEASATSAASDAVDTATDVVSTNADVVSTNADVVTCAASAATIPTISGGDAYKTLRVNAGETAYEKVTTRFKSASFTLTANTIQSFAHGLTGTPIRAWLAAKCTTIDNGYAVNDWAFDLALYDSIRRGPVNVRVDSTNVYFASGDSELQCIEQLATALADYVQMTPASWDLHLFVEVE